MRGRALTHTHTYTHTHLFVLSLSASQPAILSLSTRLHNPLDVGTHHHSFLAHQHVVSRLPVRQHRLLRVRRGRPQALAAPRAPGLSGGCHVGRVEVALERCD